MAKKELRMYPRGYMGPSLNPHEALSAEVGSELSINIVLNTAQVQSTDSKAKVTPHPVVESLYLTYKNDPLVLENFNFKEDVLRVAKSLLGSKPKEWLVDQTKSPAFTDVHIRFLEEVFKFVFEGKQGISLQGWMRMVGSDPVSLNKPIRTEPFQRELFGKLLVTFNKYVPQGDLTTLLSLWLSNNGGYAHLLTVLYILFGTDNTQELGDD